MVFYSSFEPIERFSRKVAHLELDILKWREKTPVTPLMLTATVSKQNCNGRLDNGMCFVLLSTAGIPTAKLKCPPRMMSVKFDCRQLRSTVECTVKECPECCLPSNQTGSFTVESRSGNIGVSPSDRVCL